MRVVVLEAEIAGFGASGRNGAWCSSGFPVSPGELQRRFGREATRELLLEMRGAVEEVGRVAEAEEIDAQYFRGGLLRVARGPSQLPGIQEAYESLRGLGLEDGVRLLDADETAGRVRITGARGALFNPHCATIHPARLARGLARAVERLGGEIFERTPVTDYEEGGENGSGPRLVTDSGEVRARTVVLAGEAYLARLRKLRRQLLPIYSLIVLTEPLSEERWAGIGWEGRECVASNRYTVDYLSRTEDGRILFGGRGAPYHYGSRVQRRVRQARADAPDAAQHGEGVVPGPRRRAVHPRVGRAAGRAPRLDADHVLRPVQGRSHRARLHGAGGRDGQPLGPDPGRPDPRTADRHNPFAHRRPRAASLGAGTLALAGRQVRAARPDEGGR